MTTSRPLVQAISSRDNPLLQKLRKLAADPGAYRKLQEVWVEGDHLCAASLARGAEVPVAVIAASAWTGGPEGLAAVGDGQAHELSGLALRARKVVVVPDALWSGFSGLESPARLGFVLPLQQDVSAQARVPTVVLDRLQDAGNVGTILRAAAALGVQQVLALKGTAALWSPKVLRAGMGAHWGLHLLEQLTPAVLDSLELALVATSSHADHTLPDAPLPEPCAWVLGHEGQGVSDEVMSRCAMTVRIPQPGGEESLNVGVAAGICLYESLRRRLSRPG